MRIIAAIALSFTTFSVLVVALIACLKPAVLYYAPDAQLANGAKYIGSLNNGVFDGDGQLLYPNGSHYSGQFKQGLFHGRGKLTSSNGDVYTGAFIHGQKQGLGTNQTATGEHYTGHFSRDYYHGTGKLVKPNGDTYDGEFVAGAFSGTGALYLANGSVYQGEFLNGSIVSGTYTSEDGFYQGEFKHWLYHGQGEFISSTGDSYTGNFQNNTLTGSGKITFADASYMEGEFTKWQLYGHGERVDSSGNHYTGNFEMGLYHGEGKLVLAEPYQDITTISGEWQWGMHEDDPRFESTVVDNIEPIIYAQNRLLLDQIGQLQPSIPNKTEMYILNAAGDAQGDMFNNEISLINRLFNSAELSKNRAISLVNHKNGYSHWPILTQTSIRQALKGIANKMDTDEDILFLYLTSHGSKDHKLYVNVPGIELNAIPATDIAQALQDSGIKWRVIAVSACYSGGFVDALQNEHTLIFSSARRDRMSFGCGSDDILTYFGKAFLDRGLAQGLKFEPAFLQAQQLIHKWEETEHPDSEKSEPQMYKGKYITQKLAEWYPESYSELLVNNYSHYTQNLALSQSTLESDD